jgi:hypothetical protein
MQRGAEVLQIVGVAMMLVLEGFFENNLRKDILLLLYNIKRTPFRIS